MFETFDALISVLDYTLNSKRKRHIVGGILLSVSMLFGGLAITAMTMKPEDTQAPTHNHTHDKEDDTRWGS